MQASRIRFHCIVRHFAALPTTARSRSCFSSASSAAAATVVVKPKKTDAQIKQITKDWVKKWVFEQGLCPWAGSVMTGDKLRIVIHRDTKGLAWDDEESTTIETLFSEAFALAESCNDAVDDLKMAAEEISVLDEEKLVAEGTAVSTDQSVSEKSVAEQSVEISVQHPTTEQLVTEQSSTEKVATTERSPVDSTLIVLPRMKDFDTFMDLSTFFEELLEQEDLDLYVQVATFHPRYVFDETDENDVENYTNRSPYPIIHLLKADHVTAAINGFVAKGGNTDDIWRRNVQLLKAMGLAKVKQIQKDIVRNSVCSEETVTTPQKECEQQKEKGKDTETGTGVKEEVKRCPMARDGSSKENVEDSK